MKLQILLRLRGRYIGPFSSWYRAMQSLAFYLHQHPTDILRVEATGCDGVYITLNPR